MGSSNIDRQSALLLLTLSFFIYCGGFHYSSRVKLLPEHGGRGRYDIEPFLAVQLLRGSAF